MHNEVERKLETSPTEPNEDQCSILGSVDEKQGPIHQILEIQNLTRNKISNLSSGVAAEKTELAKKRYDEINQFRNEILAEAEELNKKLNGLRSKFKQRIYDKQNQDGFLNHRVEKYVNCVGSVDTDCLQGMLQEDLIYWDAISKGAMKHQKSLQDAIERFMTEQSERLQEILFANQQLAIQTPELRKLPILSRVHKNGKIDFEWPTASDLKQFTGKSSQYMLKLSKIEVWYYNEYNFMTGIRATLSNGMQSPIFRTAGDQQGPIQLHLDRTKRPTTLGIRSQEDGVYGLKVLGKNEQDLVEWSGDYTQDWRVQEIPVGENVIGIYGLNGYGGTGIQNVGFIVTNYFAQP